jgi:hypothetical protein
VVIYSMTPSSPEDAPRGMEFLYSLNRLNVATSRAHAVVIVVGSPRLLSPSAAVRSKAVGERPLPLRRNGLVAEAPSNTRSAAPVQKADHCSQLDLPLSLLISPRCNACADEGIVRQTNRIGLISDPITIDGVPFDPSIARLDRR